MSNLPILKFNKMHGAGNDFVVLDLRDTNAPSPQLCQALADRHTGIGCDLILGIEAPRTSEAIVSYRIWTNEGLPSQQCGNGARCIAAWVLREGLTQKSQFVLDSPSGSLQVEALSLESFRITMSVPQFAPEEILLNGFDKEQEYYEVDLPGKPYLRFSAVSIGNPHAVIQVDDLESAPVIEIGQVLQNAKCTPPTVNVGFAKVVSKNQIDLRVYEFGAGETQTCGTGACAAAAVFMKQGMINRSITVVQAGGKLQIDWPSNTDKLIMTGPAKFSFKGEFLDFPI